MKTLLQGNLVVFAILMRIECLIFMGKNLRLVIDSMGEVDFGEYTCEAKNNRGVGRTHIHISGNPGHKSKRCLFVCRLGTIAFYFAGKILKVLVR